MRTAPGEVPEGVARDDPVIVVDDERRRSHARECAGRDALDAAHVQIGPGNAGEPDVAPDLHRLGVGADPLVRPALIDVRAGEPRAAGAARRLHRHWARTVVSGDELLAATPGEVSA
jgi:hypothetical protein